MLPLVNVLYVLRFQAEIQFAHLIWAAACVSFRMRRLSNGPFGQLPISGDAGIRSSCLQSGHCRT
jgi:hypothetical protein